MEFTAEQQQRHSDWLDSFRNLSGQETGLLIRTLRSMATVMAEELAPVDGVTKIGAGSIESLVALRELIGGFLHRDDDKLGRAVISVQMRMIDEGDATGIMRIAQARVDHLREVAAQQESGGIVTPAATPEVVVDSLKRRVAAAEPIGEPIEVPVTRADGSTMRLDD